MQKPLLLTLLAFSLHTPTARSSTFEECVVTTEVLTAAKDASLRVRIVKSAPADFSARCYQREDKEVEISLYCPSTPNLKIGDNIQLKATYYGAMSPAGPVSGTTWSCVE